MSKNIRKSIMAGIRRRTDEFNRSTFPQIGNDWTTEQQEIWKFLNGESGGFEKITDSDKPEIRKTLTRLAGVDMPSRFDMTVPVTIPPYVVIVLRKEIASYPSYYPLLKGRISGLYMEDGSGLASNIYPEGRYMRPATEDEVKKFDKKFPEEKLSMLYGAIDFADKAALQELITARIIEQTGKLDELLQDKFPDGITEKGKQLLKLRLSDDLRSALAIILDDPAITKPYRAAPDRITFPAYCAVIHHVDETGSCYQTERVHVNAGIGTNDIFYAYEDEWEELLGNHADAYSQHFSAATEEQIKEYVQNIPESRLHAYVAMLSKEQVESLL